MTQKQCYLYIQVGEIIDKSDSKTVLYVYIDLGNRDFRKRNMIYTTDFGRKGSCDMRMTHIVHSEHTLRRPATLRSTHCLLHDTHNTDRISVTSIPMRGRSRT